MEIDESATVQNEILPNGQKEQATDDASSGTLNTANVKAQPSVAADNETVAEAQTDTDNTTLAVDNEEMVVSVDPSQVIIGPAVKQSSASKAQLTLSPNTVKPGNNSQIVFIQGPGGNPQPIRIAASGANANANTSTANNSISALLKTIDGNFVQIKGKSANRKPIPAGLKPQYILKGQGSQIILSSPTSATGSVTQTMPTKTLSMTQAQQLGLLSTNKVRQVISVMPKAKTSTTTASVSSVKPLAKILPAPPSSQTPIRIKPLPTIHPKIVVQQPTATGKAVITKAATTSTVSSGSAISAATQNKAIVAQQQIIKLTGQQVNIPIKISTNPEKKVHYVRVMHPNAVNSSQSGQLKAISVNGKLQKTVTVSGTTISTATTTTTTPAVAATVSTPTTSADPQKQQKILIQGKTGQTLAIIQPNKIPTKQLTVNKIGGKTVIQTMATQKKIAPNVSQSKMMTIMRKDDGNATNKQDAVMSATTTASVSSTSSASHTPKLNQKLSITTSQLRKIRGTIIEQGKDSNKQYVMLPIDYKKKLERAMRIPRVFSPPWMVQPEIENDHDKAHDDDDKNKDSKDNEDDNGDDNEGNDNDDNDNDDNDDNDNDNDDNDDANKEMNVDQEPDDDQEDDDQDDDQEDQDDGDQDMSPPDSPNDNADLTAGTADDSLITPTKYSKLKEQNQLDALLPPYKLSDDNSSSRGTSVIGDSNNSNNFRRKPCNCTKSQCLKLYCDCFANGEFCSNCNCKECFNNLDNENERLRAIRSCLERNPHAFRPKIGKAKDHSDTLRRHTKGCNCKRSSCLKNYCECYEAKIACSDNCKCRDCRNIDYSEFTGDMLQPDISSMCQTEMGDTGSLKRSYDNGPGSVSDPSSGGKTSAKITTAAGAGATTAAGTSANATAAAAAAAAASSPSKQPFNFMTTDVIDATIQCMIAQADECQKIGITPEFAERMVLEEFGRCLGEIFLFSLKNNGS